MPTLTSCSTCSRQLRIPDDLLGKQVKCPACQLVFTATADVPMALEPAALPGDAAAPPPEANPFDAMQEARGAPAPGGYRQRNNARDRLVGPAWTLLALAWIIIGLCLLGMLGILIRFANLKGGPNDGAVLVGSFFQLGLCLFWIVYYWLMYRGAAQMQKMQSHGGATAACIMALLPVSGCCVLTIPFGIWGLVVLNDPEVRSAFSR